MSVTHTPVTTGGSIRRSSLPRPRRRRLSRALAQAETPCDGPERPAVPPLPRRRGARRRRKRPRRGRRVALRAAV